MNHLNASASARPSYNTFYHEVLGPLNSRLISARAPQFSSFMSRADRLYHLWQCKEMGPYFACDYSSIGSDDIIHGKTPTGHLVIAVAASRNHPKIFRLELLKKGRKWEANNDIGIFT